MNYNNHTSARRRASKRFLSNLKKISLVMLLALSPALSGQAQTFSVYAGTTGSPGYSGDGGHRLSAQFNDNWGIGIDNARGLLYVADHDNNAIRCINIGTDVITTHVGDGTGMAGFAGDGGAATGARLNHPTGLTLDGAGNLYVFDIWNYRIRMVDNSIGDINTIIGNGVNAYAGDGGVGTAASIHPCNGLSSDFAGNIYLPGYISDKVRKITPSGLYTPGTINFYGGSVSGYAGDGSPIGASTQFNYLNDLKYDWNTGNIYISDWTNNVIRKVDAGGIVSTFAGNGTYGYSTNVAAASAAVRGPMGFDLDCYGNLFFCDVDNHVIRRVDASTGIMTTVAGMPGAPGGGTGSNGQFNRPVGLALDAIGDLYVSDRNNSRIVKLAFDATICEGRTTTLCDKTASGTWSSSNAAVATVDPSGVVTGVSAGTAHITLHLSTYYLVRLVTVVGAPTAITGSGTITVGGSTTLSSTPAGGTWSSSGSVATVDPVTGVVTGVAGGVEVITYTTAAGCFVTTTVNVRNACIANAKLTITSIVDANGDCHYTATANATTAYMVMGYEWTLPGGVTVVHTSATSDVQSFTLPSGGSFLVKVKIHVVRNDFMAGESPCCETELQEEVKCDRKGGCNYEDSTRLVVNSVPFPNHPGPGIACDFTITAVGGPLPGWTILGYVWQTSTTTHPMTASGTFNIVIPHGTTETITVTIYVVDASGQRCSITRTITIDCDNGTGTSYRPGAGKGDAKPEVSGITVFPNPTSDVVEVRSGSEEITSIRVVDVNGKEIGSFNYTNTKSTSVSLSNYPPGTYLLRVNNATTKVVTKIK